MADIVERFDISLFERAANVMAIWIMRFRLDDDQWGEAPSENDKLTAGHLAGALSAQGLLADPAALSSRDAEIERLREALASCEAWIDRWTKHVGNCEGADKCTCGRTAVLFEARAALNEQLPKSDI